MPNGRWRSSEGASHGSSGLGHHRARRHRADGGYPRVATHPMQRRTWSSPFISNIRDRNGSLAPGGTARLRILPVHLPPKIPSLLIDVIKNCGKLRRGGTHRTRGRGVALSWRVFSLFDLLYHCAQLIPRLPNLRLVAWVVRKERVVVKAGLQLLKMGSAVINHPILIPGRDHMAKVADDLRPEPAR